MIRQLLETRNIQKKKKPDFLRHDYDRAVKLKNKWVKPRGKRNKMRLGIRGHRMQPTVGFSSPRRVAGLLRDGKKILIVYNLSDFEMYDSKIHAVAIAHTVGMKKRIGIVEFAKSKGIELLNIKDADKFLSNAKKQKEETRKESTDKKKIRESARAEAVKKAEENKGKKEENSK